MYGRSNRIMWICMIILLIISFTSLGIAIDNSNGKESDSNTLIHLRTSGSSTIYPLWTTAQEEIQKRFNVSLEISSTGSGNGVRAAYEKKADIGNSSRDPKLEEVISAGAKWNTVRTIKIALDVIVIYAKIPSSCNDTIFTTSPEKIINAYTGMTETMFSNLASATGDILISNDTISRGNVNLSISRNNPVLSELFNTSCNENIDLYTRNTTASGTRDGFLQIANLTTNTNYAWLNDDLFGEIIEARITKNALQTTNEANSAAEQAVKASRSAASYISFGFVEGLSNTKNSNGEVIVSIKFNNQQVNPSEETIINNEYKWTRNLNFLYDTENKNLDRIIKILDFFRVTFSGRKLVRDVGFIPLPSINNNSHYEIPDRLVAKLFPEINLPWIN